MNRTKKRGRVLTTASEIQQVAREAREREKTATKILAARYDGERDSIAVDLSTGATVVIPRSAIPGFKRVVPGELTDLSVNPGAESLWSDSADDGVLLEQLLEIAAGTELLKVAGGRISGRHRSVAKAEASRANGAKGGRPPLTMGAFIRHLDQTLHELAPNAPKVDKSDNPNPNAPASAYWHVGSRRLLYIKWHGASDIQVGSKWPRKRRIERRIRATAERIAREFARELAGVAAARSLRKIS
jgi:hypothetical protein